jgi:two-component system, sensor histidine kinase
VNAVGILKQFGKGDAELSAEQHDVIGRQSSHMARLVDDLLDVARLTSGKIMLNVQPLDLREVTRRALQTLRLMGSRQRPEVSFDSPAMPVVVRGDPVRLEQVMTNLLTNAMKYTPEGGKIRASVTHDQQAIVRVNDTGDGVPPDMLDRIFEPFTQLSPNLARSGGGLGMGLTVVKTLVEMHGGTVTAHSEGPGKGTEFEVRLPLAQASLLERQTSNVRQTVHPCDILVVEDNADSRRTLARLLQLYGHRVEAAEDGPSGLETALRRRPEVVLLDIGLPGMDGYEVGRRIRKQLAADVFLIALTGYGQPEDRERVRDAGFDLHLVKPIDPEKLNSILAARLPVERTNVKGLESARS